jgi:hypothetical protein
MNLSHPPLALLGPLLVVLLALAAPAPVHATAAAEYGAVGATSAPGPAEGGGSSKGSWRRYFSGLATRSRVIQVCVVVMALALFILMKKLT